MPVPKLFPHGQRVLHTCPHPAVAPQLSRLSIQTLAPKFFNVAPPIICTVCSCSAIVTVSSAVKLSAVLLNPFKPSGAKWLHYKVFKAILV